jgi:hypothetical protein
VSSCDVCACCELKFVDGCAQCDKGSVFLTVDPLTEIDDRISMSGEDSSVIGVIGEARLSDRLGVVGGLGVDGAESVSLSVDGDR